MSVVAGRGGVVTTGILPRDANSDVIQQYWDAGTYNVSTGGSATARFFAVHLNNLGSGGQTYIPVTVKGYNLNGTATETTVTYQMVPGDTIYGDFTEINTVGGTACQVVGYIKL